MRVALIEACNPDWYFKRFSYPLGLGYLASYLKKNLPGVEVVVSEDIRQVINLEPDLVGISSYSLNYGIAKAWGRKIKDTLGIPVILGGCHISALPETFTNDFDIAVIGEGEETFRHLISFYSRHGRFTRASLEGIEGILFFGDQQLRQTSPRHPIKPIGRIPPPARELFNIRSGTHYISTSRGCPFNCLFCAPCVIWDKTRTFPGSYVTREIGGIIEQFADSITHLMVVDDLFISHRKRLGAFRDFYVNTGLNKVLIQQCNIRADLLDEEMAGLLVDMNFRTVNFGAESGSDRILKYYQKRATVADNQRAIDLLYDRGILAIPSFIIGAPPETEEDLEATLRFIEKNHHKLAGFEVFPLVPMPGSRLWIMAREKGLVGPDFEWSRLDPNLLDFNPHRYLYMGEAMSRDIFLSYVDRFVDIYTGYNPAAMEFRNHLKTLGKEKNND